MSFSPGRSLVRQAENGTASSNRLLTDILAPRHIGDHGAGLGDRRQNPSPMFVAPPATSLVTRDHRYPAHAVQLASLIEPTYLRSIPDLPRS
jgi:hypothetical protein